MRDMAVCPLSLRERVGVREATQRCRQLGFNLAFFRPGSVLAVSLTPTLSRREREKEDVSCC
jgi:hypothetical protein